MNETLLIVVDVQNRMFNRPDDRAYQRFAFDLAKRIDNFSADARVTTTLWVMKCYGGLGPDLWLKEVTSPEDIEALPLTEREKLYHLHPRPGDFIMNKPDGHAFKNPHLLPFLQERQYFRTGIAGGYAKGCAGSTMHRACQFLPDASFTMLTEMAHQGRFSGHIQNRGAIPAGNARSARCCAAGAVGVARRQSGLILRRFRDIKQPRVNRGRHTPAPAQNDFRRHILQLQFLHVS